MKNQRGIALVTTLLMAVVVIMMVTAGVALLPSQRAMTGSMEQGQAALTAAEAGIEYVRTRLQEDQGWRGDANAVVVNEPGKLWIREDEGNVVGIVWSTEGEPGLFKIRFNFQNEDNNPEEGFDDNPSSAMMVEHPYISFNGLNRANSGPIWRAERTGDFEVDDSQSFGDVPRFAAVIYSQGLAGPGLRNVTPTNLSPGPSHGMVVTRTVEAFIGRDVSQFGDSVVYGADEVALNSSDQLLLESSTDDEIPRIRTLANVTATTGGAADDFEMTDGEVVVNQTTGDFTVNGVTSSDPAPYQADSSGSFLEIGYDQITQAGTGDARMSAGTYLWENVGGSDELVYYDVEFEDGVVGSDPRLPPLLGTGTVVNSSSDLGSGIGNSDISIKKNKLEMTVKKNILVSPTANASGVAILATPTLMAARQRRPQVEFRPKKDEPTPIVSTSGQFTMTGKLHGSGGVTAEGDITVQGESVLHSRADTQVALYSKGDVTIEPIEASMVNSIYGGGGGGGGGSGSASGGGGSGSSIFTNGINPFVSSQTSGDIVFSGVVYAQGSFNAVNPGRNFHLRGVLVAFGGDPELGEAPGTRVGSGGVNISAANTQFIYDASFVSTLMEQGGVATLNNISWRWF